ncbi:helix-turn-helix transcriptional regulator [Roseibium alexandrii]|uniref:Putative transcriptional regulator n=1 Tax=Roseibium alexandrii (strain DSM 17067 / NCIMB 14079 / DFL-11) TaxID=244592 RepID=A0A5E8H5Q9_ROSAD|nr:helix-turn-helix domain-containing protein [Roseibium alexandrii]EEE47517.1 putative transcriptional regulator [Roseibium alexandrii DFL-11]
MLNDRILTVKQTAQLLTVHPNTVYNYVGTEGFPPCIRLTERRVGFRLSDVQAYLDRQAAAA